MLKATSTLDEEAEHEFFQVVALIRDPLEAAAFLKDLCTPAELKAMSDRWRVVKPIKAGIPYRKIHDKTGVSITTVGRVARHIAHGSDGYNLIYERIEKQKNEKKPATKNRHTKKRTAF